MDFNELHNILINIFGGFFGDDVFNTIESRINRNNEEIWFGFSDDNGFVDKTKHHVYGQISLYDYDSFLKNMILYHVDDDMSFDDNGDEYDFDDMSEDYDGWKYYWIILVYIITI